jgi:hypothetical protein
MGDASSDCEAGEWEDCEVVDSLDVSSGSHSTAGPAGPLALVAFGAQAGDGAAALAALARACDAPAARAAEMATPCDPLGGASTKTPLSKYRGVIPWKAKKNEAKAMPWRVAVYIDGKRKVLDGAYATEEEAARAYDTEIRRLGRQERACNFPLIDDIPLPGPDNRVSRFRGVHLKILTKKKRKGGAGVEPDADAHIILHYTASIRVSNRSKHLGTFTNEEHAALAYDCAAREIGNTQHLNFPLVTDYSSIRRTTERGIGADDAAEHDAANLAENAQGATTGAARTEAPGRVQAAAPQTAQQDTVPQPLEARAGTNRPPHL